MVNDSKSNRYAKFQHRYRRRLEAAELAGKLFQHRRQRETPHASSQKRARKRLTSLHIGEALSLNELRAPLRYNLDALRDLLDVMEQFESSRLDIVNTIHYLSALFREKPYLIQAFNILLPERHCLDESLLPRFDAAILRSSPAPLITIESEDPSVGWTPANDYVSRARALSSNSSGPSEAGSSERKSNSRKTSGSTDYGHHYIRRGLSMDSDEHFLTTSPKAYFGDFLVQSPLALSESGSNIGLDEYEPTFDANGSTSHLHANRVLPTNTAAVVKE